MGSRRGEHRFGGDWTTKKLEVLGGYLRAYTTALKGQPFRKAYIDAFAGTGYRHARAPADTGQRTLLPDLAEAAPQKLLAGSARVALQTDPRFEKYIFIDRHTARCRELEKLRDEFANLAADIEVRKADANTALRDLCDKNWSMHRAVLFLDPYGMQVEWRTIEAVAGTRAMDVWILFPLGMGVNRLLKRSGEIPEPWRRRLDLLLGTDQWYEEFYRVLRRPTLLGDEELVIKASTDTIGRYFNDRLRTVFAGVSAQPAVLRNSTNSPLYLLCFAVGNPGGGRDIALRIANHLLEEIR